MSAPALIVAGPTASGKSALALALAQTLDGAVINADSMQLYNELRIITARPSREDEAIVPHRLYGVLPASRSASAAAWADMALAEIATARKDGRRPVITGGTGLYLKALTEGLNNIPPIPDHIRDATRELMETLGPEAFHEQLSRWDPKMAARLKPGDRQRQIRAWEVMAATGRSLADWQAEPRTAPPPDLSFEMIMLLPPREKLYAAINRRFDLMIEAGAVEEVRALLALGLDPDLPAMKATGAPELARYIRGETDLETAANAAKQATRRYAKRQMTWLRHQVPRADLLPKGALHACHVVHEQYSERLLPQIIANLRKSR